MAARIEVPAIPAFDTASDASSLGFTHRKITPYWPKANSEAEGFMRTTGKAIRTAHPDGKNYRPALNQFLLNYRATTHWTTGTSPAELLFHRQMAPNSLSLVQLQAAHKMMRLVRVMHGPRTI